MTRILGRRCTWNIIGGNWLRLSGKPSSSFQLLDDGLGCGTMSSISNGSPLCASLPAWPRVSSNFNKLQWFYVEWTTFIVADGDLVHFSCLYALNDAGIFINIFYVFEWCWHLYYTMHLNDAGIWMMLASSTYSMHEWCWHLQRNLCIEWCWRLYQCILCIEWCWHLTRVLCMHWMMLASST
jgi:hypothetical protein